MRDCVFSALSTRCCDADCCGVDRAVVDGADVEIGAGGGGVLDATFFAQPVQSTDNAVMAKQAMYRVFIK
jgi:hypothetical protein